MGFYKKTLVILLGLIFWVEAEANYKEKRSISIVNHFPQFVTSMEFIVDGQQLQVSEKYKNEKGRCKIETVLAYSSRTSFNIEPSSRTLNYYVGKKLETIILSPGIIKVSGDNSAESVAMNCKFESEGFFSPTTPFDDKSIEFLSALGFNFR